VCVVLPDVLFSFHIFPIICWYLVSRIFT